MLACRRWSQVDQCDGHGRNVTYVEVRGLADGTLDRQYVAATHAVREDRGRPRSVADCHPHPHGAKATTRSGSQVMDFLGRLGRQGDEDPTVGPPGIPPPQLGIEDNDHELSFTQADSPCVTLASVIVPIADRRVSNAQPRGGRLRPPGSGSAQGDCRVGRCRWVERDVDGERVDDAAVHGFPSAAGGDRRVVLRCTSTRGCGRLPGPVPGAVPRPHRIRPAGVPGAVRALVPARESSNVNDFALVAILGLLGLRIFEACAADIADLGEEHGHRGAAGGRQGHQDRPRPVAARGRTRDRPRRRRANRRAAAAQPARHTDAPPRRHHPPAAPPR
jgi:hypothetical protein